MNPSKKTILLLLVSVCGPLVVSIFNLSYFAGWLTTLIALGIIIADRFKGTFCDLTIKREFDKVLSVGIENKITLFIKNNTNRQIVIEVVDEAPLLGKIVANDSNNILLEPFESKEISYGFIPDKRGRFLFEAVQYRFISRLGFWIVTKRIKLKSNVQVYPNIKAISEFELLAKKNSLFEQGFFTTRRAGEGQEFERMRDYREGDEPRKVDWKTTARLGKLIVREMGEERNQNVLFMIDMGRLMKQTSGGISHFDYALNTAIILGHMARKKGDNVGAILFSDRVVKYIPLSKGEGAVDTLVLSTFDVYPESVSTNYENAFKYLMENVKKRSMVLLMTHVASGENEKIVETFMAKLQRNHLPLCLFFKDVLLEKSLNKAPENKNEAFEKAALAQMFLENEDTISRLKHQGVMALNVLPEEFSAIAVNNYLDIKARHLL